METSLDKLACIAACSLITLVVAGVALIATSLVLAFFSQPYGGNYTVINVLLIIGFSLCAPACFVGTIWSRIVSDREKREAEAARDEELYLRGFEAATKKMLYSRPPTKA